MRAIYATRAFETTHGQGYPKGDIIWIKYIHKRISGNPFLSWPVARTIRDAIDYILAERPQDQPKRDMYTYLLCEKYFGVCGRYILKKTFNINPKEQDFSEIEKASRKENILAAAAELGLEQLVEKVLDNWFHDESVGIYAYFGNPLLSAIQQKNAKMARMLLEVQGGPEETREEMLLRALSRARSNKMMDLVQLIPVIDKSDPVQQCEHAILGAAVKGDLARLQSHLDKAIEQGYLQKMELRCLVNKTRSFSRIHDAILAKAAEYGHEGIAQYAIDCGANVNVQLKRNTPHFTALGSAVYRGDKRIVDMLLSRGADPNSRPFTCPLYYAARLGWLEIARMLIEKGAEVNPLRPNHKNDPPLLAAAENGNAKIFALLLDHGADITIHPDLGRKVFTTVLCGGYATMLHNLMAKGIEVPTDITGFSMK